MKSKLGIDFDKVGHAREMARKIADQVQDFVDGYTTVAVERTLCRLLGIDGAEHFGRRAERKERVGRRNFILSG